MIKQLKLSIKLMRYTYGIKMCVILGIVFFACGIGLSFVPENRGGSGSFFIVVAAMWITQLFYSLGVSNMVQASPYGKAAQTSMPTLIGLLGFTAAYVVVVLMKLLRFGTADGEVRRYMSADLITVGMLTFIVMLYIGLAYKFFVAATVLFAVTFAITTSSFKLYTIFDLPLPSIGGAAVIGFLEIVAGALVQYGVSRLVYKCPVSKRAQLRGLQRYM